MKTGTKIATAGTFGAALVAMGIAPELDAAIVNLTFTPGSLPYNAGPGTTLVGVSINQVAGSIQFSQWNDYIGRTLILGLSGTISAALVSVSQSLDPNTFFPGTSNIAFTLSKSGTTFVGFRAGANVGWFSIQFQGLGGDLVYLTGQYGNAGETVHVPAPGALALLALGAVGVRRNRKRAA